MLKYSDNPPMLPTWVDSVEDLAGRWWVAHTKARHEKALAWDLHNRQIGYFLPMYEKRFSSGGRQRRVLMPFFPSYLFLCGDPDQRHAALRTDRLCQTVEVTDQEELVRELLAFERVLAQGPPLQVLPTISQGRLCRITSGPFRGIEGPVVRIGRAAKIVLRVSAIAQGALLEIDAGLLEPVG